MSNYIVIASPSCGGAEKRFFDIFRGLLAEGVNVVMIAPSTLTKQLLSDNNNPDLFSAVLSIEMSEWSRKKFIIELWRVLRNLPKGSSFHYPMNCLWPLHFFRDDHVTMSVTNCINLPSLVAGTHTGIWTWLSFFFVKRVDVLSPAIFSQMTHYTTAKKMSLTPGGTYLSASVAADKEREPTVVLMSRLVPQKGIDDFIDVLPNVWSALRGRVPIGFSFVIAGKGPLQEHVVTRVGELVRSGVPVSFVGFANSTELLTRSAVVLSMQEVTNYPSRVVAEALVAGCAVIVRNTGDSRQFGNELLGLDYCAGALDPLELAELIGKWINRIFSQDEVSKKIAAFSEIKFRSKVSIDYFRSMFCSNSGVGWRDC
jgi:glycosyltransferase involved in cell wall biosynthesis